MTAAPPPRTVLVGVDDTSEAWLAADWAATEARLRGTGLRLLHAVGPGSPAGDGADARVLDAAASVLDDAVARIAAAHPGVPLETALAHEQPAEALIDAARDAGLVVVGTRGRGGFSGLLLGSVSLRTAAHADRPVVVARGHTEKAAHGGVVVGVRDERDADAVRFALAEARLRGVGVRILHAWVPHGRVGRTVPDTGQVDDEERVHARLLEHAARPIAEYPQVQTDTELVIGAPAAALVDASARAGLVVVARQAPAGRFALRLGSVVHAVLHHAECPVAVLPTAAPPEET
ncbi:universal stress protein [Streptomyces sp. NPDC014802]|uniref:universal stress protein n=1 Tax=Streptomyces sp. NPDC014802 TaxID=3364917 RepID=UPI0036F8FCF4